MIMKFHDIRKSANSIKLGSFISRGWQEQWLTVTCRERGGTGLANLSPKSVKLFFPFFIGQTGPPETWGSLCPDVHSERYVRPIHTGLGVCLR